MAFFNDKICSDCMMYQYEIEQLRKNIKYLTKELNLYKSHYTRPKILKEVIHHPARPKDSQCLYGVLAWDEYVYE